MDDEPTFQRITPSDSRRADAVSRPWLIKMSDWPVQSAQTQPQLATLIETEVDKVEGRGAIPTILVVNDLRRHDADYQGLLTSLTKAGAFVVEPENETEAAAVRTDVLGYANDLLVASRQAAPARGTSTSDDFEKWMEMSGAATAAHTRGAQPAKPVHPDGFLEFAKAITRLPANELEDMMKPVD